MLSERDLQNSLNGRRSFMKLLAAAPLFATIGTRSLAATGEVHWQAFFLRQYLHPAWRPPLDQRAWHLDLSVRFAGTAGDAAGHGGGVPIILSTCLSCRQPLAAISRSSPEPNLEWSPLARRARWLRRLRAASPGLIQKMSGNCPTQPA